MTDYTVSSFVTDGSTPRSFDDLSLQNKVAIKALVALEALSSSLANIATVQTVENLGSDVAALQAQNTELIAQVNTLQTQLSSLRSILQQIDQITDEAVD
jgi:phage shock protein A